MMKTLRQSFLEPDKEFTPFPFWFWNDDLSETEISHQMREFKEKGIDGVVIHPRMGLSREIVYLSERYLYYVEYAVKRAKEMDMHIMLYDEAMYPSGSCHGEVVKENPAFASRGLRMSESGELKKGDRLETVIERDGKQYFFVESFSGGTIRGVYENEDDGQINAPKSADLLNPDAVSCFIRHTHEKYYQYLNEYFGNTIIAIFTDEPCILGRCAEPGLIAWSSGMLEEFMEAGGNKEDLYWLFVENDIEQEQIRRAKKIYDNAVYNRMSTSYYKQIAEWCGIHGIALTGHPEKSMDIGYLQYFTIPCQDLVWRFVAPEDEKGLVGEHSTMAKCSADSARHRGKRRNGNECFGCCSRPENPYVLSKEDMKWYLDWLFVRGVNLILPHAFYYSIRGKRLEERPPEVGMHSGYWEEYRQITDYIKRMCYLLTDSFNQAEVAVLCCRQKLSWEMVKALFENQIEFNYLEEELLQDGMLCHGGLRIAEQFYSVILTDGDIGKDAERFLRKYEAVGGTVVFYQDEKDMIGQVLSHIHMDMQLQPPNRGLRKTHFIKDGISFYLLTNEGDTDMKGKISVPDGVIRQIWDAWTGEIIELETPEPETVIYMKKRESKILIAWSGKQEIWEEQNRY